jgi:hypothetical protein
MKKIFSKFWGVALVVMMLSSLIIVSAPAAAAPYAFADSVPLPNLPLMNAGLGFVNVAQSGDVVYAIGLNAGANSFYKSADGGATWVSAFPLPAATVNW